MADLIKLFVNGVEVEVESGKNLVDAIGAVGIEIPHLCYHPALGADGNCRMCLVGIEDGRPPLVPACKTPAQPGMKVLLDAEHIKKIQHDVMEFELINHPIDCPVCDQAGECKLQDYYMSYDQKPSRMKVPQVVKGKKMDFGGGVVHDQERCVVCGRCVRFLRQVTGTGELGIINRTDAARVNIFPGRPINNRYGLNVVDLCPVGAMTSQDFRFKQRVWFLKKDRSVCHGCARGCNIYIDHNREKYKDDLIYRFRPRYNAQINGYFMCDAGRLSYKEENEGRLSEAKVGGQNRSFDDVLTICRQEIERAQKTCFILSPDCSLEQMAAVKALADQTGAAVSGFSDGYILAGDGDDYLICDDKAANRAGLSALGIASDRQALEQAMTEATLVVNCNNRLTRSLPLADIKRLLGSAKLINIASHVDDLAQMADLNLPCASYSEYAGCLINCDQVLQAFNRAVQKNEQAPELLSIIAGLGGPLGDSQAAFTALRTQIPGLAAESIEQIPAEGLKLTASEAANVNT